MIRHQPTLIGLYRATTDPAQLAESDAYRARVRAAALTLTARLAAELDTVDVDAAPGPAADLRTALRTEIERAAEYGATLADIRTAATEHHTPTDRPLYLVTCGAHKQPIATRADQLYTGGYSRMCLNAARALTTEDADIRILSARHGSLTPDTITAPYDTHLRDADAITALGLLIQAATTAILHRPVTVFAGSGYTLLAQQVWAQVQTPLAGLPGIGAHRRRLAEITRAKTL